MFDNFVDWLSAVLGPNFQLSDGGFVDGPLFNNKFMAVIHSSGPAPDVDDRTLRTRVILLGPKEMREAVSDIRAAAENLMQACLGDTVPCGAASVRAMMEPVGPSYTTDDRAWMSVELQTIY